MSESGVDIRTIGLFAAVGVPYTVKFLWAPFVDALDVPVLSALLGRRRGWLLLTQLVLMAAIVLLAFCDPRSRRSSSPVRRSWWRPRRRRRTSSSTPSGSKASRRTSRPAGMASYVAAYRIGALVSGAGALFLVTGFQGLDLGKHAAWTACYIVMAALLLVGVIATFLATEPEKSAAAEAEHTAHARDNPVQADALDRSRQLSRTSSRAIWRLSCSPSWRCSSSPMRSPRL